MILDGCSMKDNFTAIILAAGKGTRMKSKRAKVLQRVNGWPILWYVLRATTELAPSRFLVVVGNGAQAVRKEFSKWPVEFIEQREQLGTGHAVFQAYGHVSGEFLLIVPGDLPLLTSQVLSRFISCHNEQEADLSVLSMVPATPGAYGRLKRDIGGHPVKIVEERDATDEELDIVEVNSGIYCVRNDEFLWLALRSLNAGNAQGEYYLTDLVEHYHCAGKHVTAIKAADPQQVMGVNSRSELAMADRSMRLRKARELMGNGVTIVDPESTYIEPNVMIGPDTVILPGTHLSSGTTVGSDCTLGPETWIDASKVEDEVVIRYSVIESARVRTGTTIGPYSHLRPGADVGPGARIGNFVEVKAARLRRGVKAGHLTYIGDSEVGENVNIGAGTITCNYDGKAKHRTIIKDGAFIGSNTSIVAPVTIGERAVIGAGSTITEDVPPGTLAIGRARQVNKHKKEEVE